jgi:hypothetical protein
MLESQGGVCAICKAPPGKKWLHVDHSHKTGDVRGLLCGNCNAAIGMTKESVSILNKMIEYLTLPSAVMSEEGRRFVSAQARERYSVGQGSG